MVRILVRRFAGPVSQLGYEPLEIGRPSDCRQLIRTLVKATLATWTCSGEPDGGGMREDECVTETAFSGPLSQAEIQAGVGAGGVKFGRRHSLGLPEEGEAVEAAEAAFTNGLVRIFINNDEVRNLEDALLLQDDDKVCLIALSGLRSG